MNGDVDRSVISMILDNSKDVNIIKKADLLNEEGEITDELANEQKNDEKDFLKNEVF